MKFYIAFNEDREQMFTAESVEELKNAIVKHYVYETDTLLSVKVASDYIKIEWRDQYMDEDELYDRIYDFQEVSMGSHVYLR